MNRKGPLCAMVSLAALLLLPPRTLGQSCQASVQNKVGDTISVIATLFTSDPNENGEGESVTVASSGGEIAATIGSYNLAAPFSYTATAANETITGTLNNFDDDETCSITATANPAPGFTPKQKQTASKAALATGLTGIGVGVAFTLLCASGAGTPLCIGLLGLSTVGGASSLTLGYIASDPADPNYTQIAKPVIGTIPNVQPGNGLTPEEAKAFNALFNIDARIYGVGIAAYTSANRAQGAKNAGSSFWEQRQLNAAMQYNKTLGGLLDEDVQARSKLSQLLQEAGITATITPAAVFAAEQQIAVGGLPLQEVQELTALGLSSADIQQLTQLLIVPDVNAASGTFPELLVSPGYVNAMKAAAQAFEGSATACIINSSSNQFSTGQPTTFKAVVTAPPATGTPTGKITFVDSANSHLVLGTAPLGGGSASITVALQAPPDRQWIQAVYSGDNSFQECKSPFIAEDYSGN